MAHKPTNVFFRNRETGWCSHATVEISDIAEFKRQARAVDLPVLERRPASLGFALPKKMHSHDGAGRSAAIFIPAPEWAQVRRSRTGRDGIFIDYEPESPMTPRGHGSMRGARCELLPAELTDEPNLNAYGFTPV